LQSSNEQVTEENDEQDDLRSYNMSHITCHDVRQRLTPKLFIDTDDVMMSV